MNDSQAEWLMSNVDYETVRDGGYVSKKMRPERLLICDEFISVGKKTQRLFDICRNDRWDDLDVWAQVLHVALCSRS